MEINIENERRKALIFKEKKIKIHVSCNSNTFYNGIIKDVGEDFFIIEEAIWGEKLILFAELNRGIEPFVAPPKKEDGNTTTTKE